MIRKEGNKYIVRSESGEKLGEEKTKAAAEKRLREIEYFKHKGEKKK